MPTDLDYADTAGARRNREAKVPALAGWCWDRGITPEQLAAAPAAELAAAARAAGVNPPRPRPGGPDTWGKVRDALAAKDAWAAEHPDHPAAARPHARPAGCNCPLVCAPKVCRACPACTPPALAEEAGPAGPPRGWADVVALGPVPGRRCWCKAPAVRWVTTYEDGPSWRCAGHPPGPGDWGYALNWAPRPCLTPLRCYCGRCDPPALAPLPRYSDTRSNARQEP